MNGLNGGAISHTSLLEWNLLNCLLFNVFIIDLFQLCFNILLSSCFKFELAFFLAFTAIFNFVFSVLTSSRLPSSIAVVRSHWLNPCHSFWLGKDIEFVRCLDLAAVYFHFELFIVERDLCVCKLKVFLLINFCSSPLYRSSNP